MSLELKVLAQNTTITVHLTPMFTRLPSKAGEVQESTKYEVSPLTVSSVHKPSDQ